MAPMAFKMPQNRLFPAARRVRAFRERKCFVSAPCEYGVCAFREIPFENIRAIFWDLGGTLYQEKERDERARLQRALAKRQLGEFRQLISMPVPETRVPIGAIVDLGRMEVLKAPDGISDCNLKVLSSQRSREAFLAAMAGAEWKKLRGISTERNEKMLKDPARFGLAPNPRVVEFFAVMKKTGRAKMAVITNTEGRIANGILEAIGLCGFIDCIVSSAKKPLFAQESYGTAARALGVEPSQTLVVGDNFLNDIAGAKLLEYNTALLGRENAFSAECTDLHAESLESLVAHLSRRLK